MNTSVKQNNSYGLLQLLDEIPDQYANESWTIAPIGYEPYSSRPETYIVPFVFFVIFIIGLIGNGTLVLIFVRNRAMRNAPNTYILCLALGDLLVILVTIPFTSTAYTMESWPYGLAVCKASEFAKDISIGVSVFTLTALSADRFFAIVDPLKKLHCNASGGVLSTIPVLVCFIIWFVSILFAMPGVIGAHIRLLPIEGNLSINVCYPFPEEWGDQYAKCMIAFRFLMYFVIPLFVIGIFYVMIARHLIQSVNNVPGEMPGTQRQVLARRKVATTVLAFVVIFAVCFVPTHVFMLWFYYIPSAHDDYNVFWHMFRIFGFCLCFANSCVNPIALYCLSGTFRKYFNRYLLCERRMPEPLSQCSTGTFRRANSGSQSTARSTSCRHRTHVTTVRSRYVARRSVLTREPACMRYMPKVHHATSSGTNLSSSPTNPTIVIEMI